MRTGLVSIRRGVIVAQVTGHFVDAFKASAREIAFGNVRNFSAAALAGVGPGGGRG